MLDLIAWTNNPKIQFKTSDVDSVKFAFTLNNNGTPVDLTGFTAKMAIKNPNNDTFSQDCTIDDATLGQFSCVLSQATYQLIGDYSAEVSIFQGTEIDTSFPFYYQVSESIPLS